MLNSKRIFIYGPLAALILLGLAYSIYWFVIVSKITAELARLDGNEIIPGINFQFTERNVGGFPFRFEVFLSGVTIAAQGDKGTIAWQSERIALHAMSYGRRAYILEVDGLQTFTWPAEGDAPQNIVQVNTGITRASALIEDGHLARFDIDVLNAEGRDVSQNAAMMREFRFARAQIHLLVQEDDTIGILAELDAGEIGSGYQPALGTNLSRLRIEGRVSEANALEELRRGGAEIRAALEAWKNARGTIILDPVEAAWGGTLLMGRSELALDEEYRVSGLLTASPEDPVSFLGALSQSEMISADARTQLTGFHKMAAGFTGNLDLPIRLEARLPLGAEPMIPTLHLEGTNGITVMFGSAAEP
jgi:hypothetical protein